METEEQEQERLQRMHDEMRKAGASVDEFAQVDYFGFEEVHQVFLGDGKSYVEHRTLNEGARRRYLNSVNRELRLQKGGDAFMKMATGDERHALLTAAICGWDLVRADKTGEMKPLQYNETNLRAFLESAPPMVVDKIEKDVREKNPWITGDITVEDIDQQIDELKELREKKIKEAEGKEP